MAGRRAQDSEGRPCEDRVGGQRSRSPRRLGGSSGGGNAISVSHLKSLLWVLFMSAESLDNDQLVDSGTRGLTCAVRTGCGVFAMLQTSLGVVIDLKSGDLSEIRRYSGRLPSW